MIRLDSIVIGLMIGFLAGMIRRFGMLLNLFQCHPRCLELSLHVERGLIEEVFAFRIGAFAKGHDGSRRGCGSEFHDADVGIAVDTITLRPCLPGSASNVNGAPSY
jgi:hypothetical protein